MDTEIDDDRGDASNARGRYVCVVSICFPLSCTRDLWPIVYFYCSAFENENKYVVAWAPGEVGGSTSVGRYMGSSRRRELHVYQAFASNDDMFLALGEDVMPLHSKCLPPEG